MAIDLLGLRNTEYRGDAERSAVRAVAIQVNYQVEMGVEGVTYSSLSRGARSFESRDGLVDPRAQAIVDGLALTGAGGEPGDLWPTVGSFRPTV